MAERRVSEEPRRKEDRHVCVLHDLIQSETEDHRDMVCKKIAAKADGSEVKGLAKLIVLLVSICCIVIAGQAIWLRADSSKLDDKIDKGFDTIHRRISDANTKIELRVENDNKQMQQLAEISGQLGTVSWRLSQIEKANEPVNKLNPNKK